jgi:2-(1,2-epoxy-1,2-dihydrophenyl)acetyl-CoA isomerase
VTEPSILEQRDGGVAQLTLNRPDVLNSFNREMASAFQNALRKAGEDDAVRAVLITGAGRAFCAGQDLDEVRPVEGETPALGETVAHNYNPTIHLIATMEKPVVCAVNGVAAGAGANIALACDIVLASEQASFIQSFAKIGLIPDSGGTFFLPRLVGIARAKAMAMLAEKISAKDAKDMGLIYDVVDADDLMKTAARLAAKLATQPTLGFGLTKRAMNAAFTNDLESQLALEENLQAMAGQSEDYTEGVKAFLEKRAPAFTGR